MEGVGFKKDAMQLLTCLRNIRFDFRCFGSFHNGETDVITSDDDEDDDEDDQEGVEEHDDEAKTASRTVFSSFVLVLVQFNRKMMIWRSKTLFLLVILGIILTQIESLRFELESGHTKCIAEEIKGHSMTVGKYHIVNTNEGYPLPDTHKVTVRVSSAQGNSHTHHYAENVHEGHFSFETAEGADYHTCFTAAVHKPPVKLTIDFDWKSGVAAKDWTNVAKRTSVEAMELELKHMLEIVQGVHDEMFYLREREEEMQELNRDTSYKLAWMTGLSILICLSVAGLQVWHLKTFFEKKKLI